MKNLTEDFTQASKFWATQPSSQRKMEATLFSGANMKDFIAWFFHPVYSGQKQFEGKSLTPQFEIEVRVQQSHIYPVMPMHKPILRCRAWR